MQFNIEILSITGPVKNQKGKNTWNVIEVAYKKDGKIEGKKVVDFTNLDVFQAVREAKQGEVYTVTAEKPNDAKFWQWTGFVRANGVQEAPSTPEVSAANSGRSSSKVLEKQVGRVTGSNYETPEERKVKQRLIVRQAALNAANAHFGNQSGQTGNTPEQVMEIAEKFVKFVYKTSVEDAVESLKALPDDIPY